MVAQKEAQRSRQRSWKMCPHCRVAPMASLSPPSERPAWGQRRQKRQVSRRVRRVRVGRLQERHTTNTLLTEAARRGVLTPSEKGGLDT